MRRQVAPRRVASPSKDTPRLVSSRLVSLRRGLPRWISCWRRGSESADWVTPVFSLSLSLSLPPYPPPKTPPTPSITPPFPRGESPPLRQSISLSRYYPPPLFNKSLFSGRLIRDPTFPPFF